MASPVLRLLIDNYPEALADYEPSIYLICNSNMYLYGTWISSWYYMSITAIIFRSGNQKSSVPKCGFVFNCFNQVCPDKICRPGLGEWSLLLQHGHDFVQHSLLDHQHQLLPDQPRKHFCLLNQTRRCPSDRQHLQVGSCWAFPDWNNWDFSNWFKVYIFTLLELCFFS